MLANVGALHRRAGYYLRALKAWDEAWTLTKDDVSPNGRAIADLAVGSALDMLARPVQLVEVKQHSANLGLYLSRPPWFTD